MRIEFDTASAASVFEWSSVTGDASLTVGGERFTLQTATQLSSHFSGSRTRAWVREVNGHTIEIAKRRPIFLPWLLPNEFTVVVDGVVVASAKGV